MHRGTNTSFTTWEQSAGLGLMLCYRKSVPAGLQRPTMLFGNTTQTHTSKANPARAACPHPMALLGLRRSNRSKTFLLITAARHRKAKAEGSFLCPCLLPPANAPHRSLGAHHTDTARMNAMHAFCRLMPSQANRTTTSFQDHCFANILSF